MLKKTIKYTDYNGQKREEDFYFNLTEAEMVILDASEPEGYLEKMKQVGNSHNGAAIMDMFRKFIHLSYGEKSPDGKYFDKSDEISNKFEHTEAYNVLFMELCTNAKKAAAFVGAVMPFDDEKRSKYYKMMDEFEAKMNEEEQKKAEEAQISPIAVDGEVPSEE